MRPRVFPAEDGSRGPAPGATTPRFNEAAGIPRGRLSLTAPAPWRCASFNEAAGIPRGRRTLAPAGGAATLSLQ